MQALLVILALAGPPQDARSPAPSAPAQEAVEFVRDAPVARYDSLVAACETVGVDVTGRAFEGEGAAAITWIVRVRLGLAETAGPWSDGARQATTQALRARSSQSRDEIVAQLFEAPDPLPFEAAMLALSELGDERDLALLVDWVLEFAKSISGEDPALEQEPRPEPAQALRASVEKLSQQSAADRELWLRAFERLPEELRVALVRGLADCGSPDALVRLAGWIGSGALHESVLLAELARAARRSDRLHSEDLRRLVRPMLDADSAEVLRDAALCAGALGDEESVHALIAKLDHAHPGVRANAEWSLSRITGRRLGPVAASWSRWIESESAWWRRDAPGLLQQLANGNPQARVAAAQELSTHRFPRHTLALEMAEALPLNDRGAAPIVLATLRQLGSESAVDVLLRRAEAASDTGLRDDLMATVGALRPAPAGPAADAPSR
jgi:HEAT repeat protein